MFIHLLSNNIDFINKLIKINRNLIHAALK